MPDFFDKLDELMGHVEMGAEKLASALGHVHVEGKEDEAPPPAPPPAEAPPPPPAFVFGGIAAKDGRGIIWHAFDTSKMPAATLCKPEKRVDPETWWRPNPNSREAILFCFGCLSRIVLRMSTVSAQRSLTP